MVVLWPLVLVGAVVLLGKSRQRGLGRRGWPWFAGWTLAGALFMLSFLTSLSVGVFLFLPAATAVFWLALNAPYARELAGFAVGIAAVVLALLLGFS
ncbi:MAG: hypothetical protein ABI896_05275 [Actinomycetota bacterium]